MSKINARSPFFVPISGVGLDSATMKLFIYTGTRTADRPITETRNLLSTAINNKLTFELSEFVRDFINNDFNGLYTSRIVWVDYEITRTVLMLPQPPDAFVSLIGFDGYGYHEEGANPQDDLQVLQSNLVQFINKDSIVNVPVQQRTATSFEFKKEGVVVFSQAIDPTKMTDKDVIVYASNLQVSARDFEARVLADAGTFEENSCLAETLLSFKVDVDTLEVNGTTALTLVFKEIEECKHTPFKLTFINKFGAFQDLWFFKNTALRLQVKKEVFKANNVVDGSYDISQHSDTIYRKSGKQSLSLNTGFYPESFNEVFRQFQLSEKVWIDFESEILPINVSDSSFSFKTQVKDRLINYTINIDFAFNKINTIR